MKKLLVLSLLLLTGCSYTSAKTARLDGYVAGCSDIVSELLARQGYAPDLEKLTPYCSERAKQHYNMYDKTR